MPSIILDFVFITVNPVNMAPVFRNFTNKHTKKYYDEGGKTTGATGEYQGPYFGTGWGQERLAKKRTLELRCGWSCKD